MYSIWLILTLYKYLKFKGKVNSLYKFDEKKFNIIIVSINIKTMIILYKI